MWFLTWFRKDRKGKGPVKAEAPERQNLAEEIGSKIVAIHSYLMLLPSFNPGKHIDDTFTTLVHLCSQNYDTETIQKVLRRKVIQNILPTLRGFCAEAEGHLEMHWAQRIVAGMDTVKDFPYYKNYENLTRLELSAIYAVNAKLPTKIAFLGSGPLPMSSLAMYHALKQQPSDLPLAAGSRDDVELLNVDCSPTAINISSRVAAKMGYTPATGMEFFCSDAGSAELPLANYDVVYFAALIADTQESKERILLKIVGHMREGALLVVRSAWGLRTCLYPEIDLRTEKLLEILDPCLVVHPSTDIINSVVIARVKRRGQ